MLFKPAILLLFLLWIVSSLDAAPLLKVEIADAIDKNAVCNDGTPGIYYLRDGFGTGANRWVIGLEGGYFCNTPGCDGRNSMLVSSSGAPTAITHNVGLLSDNSTYNPDFYNANMVVIWYCSSDLWSGNRFEPSGSRPIQFRGRKIFQNVIGDLIKKNGNNLLSPGTELLLVGFSAGGAGVMVHLDWLSKKLPDATVRGLNDSGWFPEQSSAVSPVFESEIAKGIPLWKGKADSNCQRANRTKKSKCYLSTAYPYITSPLFIAESQWDWAFVGNPSEPAGKEFEKAVRDSLVTVEAAFSPRLYTHGLSTRIIFSTLKIGTVTFKDVLGNWFFERAGKVKAIKK